MNLTTLTLSHIVKREEKKSSRVDQRRKLTRVTASYTGDDGHEYRKSFESYGEPIVPDSGTHQSLNQLERQW